MAMNKREQAEFDKARSHRSLRFSDYPVNKDMIPESGTVTGFNVNANSFLLSMGLCPGHTQAVYEAWSTTTLHGTGLTPPSTYEFGGSSRGSVPLFSTRKRALGALRRELEDKFAGLLLQIDDAIAEEDAKDAIKSESAS